MRPTRLFRHLSGPPNQPTRRSLVYVEVQGRSDWSICNLSRSPSVGARVHMQTAAEAAGAGKGKRARSLCAAWTHAEHLSSTSANAPSCRLHDHRVSLTSSDISANMLAKHADLVKQHELIGSDLTCIFVRAAYDTCHLALSNTPFANAPAIGAPGLGGR